MLPYADVESWLSMRLDLASLWKYTQGVSMTEFPEITDCGGKPHCGCGSAFPWAGGSEQTDEKREEVAYIHP